jgi:nanoRNase/pAp phosphatase (c-di-AMP/oligoRNAs hydrolase)
VFETNGVKYAFFNTTSHWAEVGEYAVEKLGVDYSFAITVNMKDKQIKGSIRAAKGANCLPLATALGGGGHPGAAGCQFPLNMSPMEIKERIDLYFKENGK